jgi:predicted GNAT family N-acyltransferase
MNKPGFNIEQVRWPDKQQYLRQIRTTVFIEEQKVPEDMEWEAEDKTCVHLLVNKGADYIATARLLNSGQIGRMAVLKQHRKTGVGAAMLKRLISIAEDSGLETVSMNAQVEAIGFYEKYGFQVEGDVFDDAGIPHRRMVRSVSTHEI